MSFEGSKIFVLGGFCRLSPIKVLSNKSYQEYSEFQNGLAIKSFEEVLK